jgi:hypothetical protein
MILLTLMTTLAFGLVVLTKVRPAMVKKLTASFTQLLRLKQLAPVVISSKKK